MSKFAGNPVLDGHLDQPELAEALDKSQRTIMRWCEDPQDPLPYIKLAERQNHFQYRIRPSVARPPRALGIADTASAQSQRGSVRGRP